MAAGLPQFHPRHVRRIDKRVATLQVLVPHPVFHGLADDAALGVPENQPRARQLLYGKQVELLAQHAMVAFFGFLNFVEKFIELLARKKRRPINALQLRIFFVPQPVRPGDAQQLEGLDSPGGGDVRPAAEIQKFSGAIDGNFFIGRGELLDEVALHEIAFVFEAL